MREGWGWGFDISSLDYLQSIFGQRFDFENENLKLSEYKLQIQALGFAVKCEGLLLDLIIALP